MGVLRFLWRRVLAFDRLGSRIPQLTQIWLMEFFVVMPLMFFIGKVIDIHGAFGVSGTGECLGGTFWGALVVSLVFGFFFVRSLVKPRVVKGSWAPMVHADTGPVTVYGSNRAWSVTYPYLTSHPSYALLLLITAPIPAVMFAATIKQGDSTFYWRLLSNRQPGSDLHAPRPSLALPDSVRHRSSPPSRSSASPVASPIRTGNSSARRAATAASTAALGDENAATTPPPVCLNRKPW